MIPVPSSSWDRRDALEQMRTATSSVTRTAPRSIPQVLSDAFKKLVARSGLPRIRLHDLRHTHATLLKPGIPIKVVSERLGHATPAFTMATYQHVLPGMQAEAARAFAAILDTSTGSPR